MIHSARPIVSPVANIVFALFCFARFWKVGTDGRTTCAQTMITTGRDCGAAEWINNYYKTGVIKSAQFFKRSYNFQKMVRYTETHGKQF